MFSTLSGDEGFALIVSAILALITWGIWVRDLLFVMRPWVRASSRIALLAMPVFCGGLVFWILKSYAASDVRDDGTYLLFYLVMGAAWVGMGQRLLPVLGLSARDDVIERNNAAAGYAISGALIGLACCFAGANVGEGPGWWVVLFSSGLASGSLALLWIVLVSATRLADTITIERDAAAGMRAAGFLIGAGMILGRAAAGNWISAQRTISDFLRVGCPALLLLALALAAEKLIPARQDQAGASVLLRGGVVGALQILAGLVVIKLAGSW